MTDYSTDIKTYVDNVDEDVVKNIVKFCGIALQSKDASLVSSSSKSELETVQNGFAAKKLGLDEAAAKAGIDKVCEKMKGVQQKSRVTFYYLLATETDTMDKLK